MQKAISQEIVEVAKAPGDEAQTSDAEERVEDLRVDLKPDASRGIQVLAVFDPMKTFGIAHILIAAADK